MTAVVSLLVSLLSAIGSVISALRYELARLRGVRALRGVMLSALFGSAILTIPAARHMIGLAHSLPPLPHSARPDDAHINLMIALVSQYTPMHGGGPWVAAGGMAGMVLPGVAAAWAAAWFGATSIGYEFRSRGGLLTFILVPRRGSVLVAKCAVAAGFGALLSLGTTAAAYGTARLAFRLSGTHLTLPFTLLAPQPRAAALAALGGALGVFAGAVLRVRALATFFAVIGCALVAAFLPRSSSLAIPYLVEAARYIVREVPGVTYSAAMNVLFAVPLVALVLSGLVAVRRRRVV